MTKDEKIKRLEKKIKELEESLGRKMSKKLVIADSMGSQRFNNQQVVIEV